MPTHHSASKHWVITGGAGFIGSHVVKALLLQNQKVTVLDDFSSSSMAALQDIRSQIRIIRGSILDPKKLHLAFKDTHYVVHLAAVASVAESFQNPAATLQTNVEGTAYVLQQAHLAGVKKVLLMSSSSVYGMGGKSARKETSRLNPLSPYAISKLLGEELGMFYAQNYGLDVVIARGFNIYAPNQPALSSYAAVLAQWSQRAKEDQALRVNGDGLQTRDFLHVQDTARALLKIVKKGKTGQVYNVGSGKSVTLLKVVKLLEKAVQKPLKISFQAPRVGDVRYSRADIRQLRALGFAPTISLEKGLKDFFD
ncbi:MAG: NAD-dependent epimerase/dehydratase family protein [Elusimicrobiaceae bacterium]|nr:NAD-dependent epimerase/dehydratase family protein [Elusimicrobiaceae bacterium]